MEYKDYVLIPGIAGTSADVAHLRWIEAVDFRLGHRLWPGEAAGHDPDALSFTFWKVSDASSAKLFQAVASGEHFQNVRVDRMGDRRKIARYLFDDALFLSAHPGASTGEGLSIEEFKVGFTKLTEPA